jgi:hypothetical protein
MVMLPSPAQVPLVSASTLPAGVVRQLRLNLTRREGCRAFAPGLLVSI